MEDMYTARWLAGPTYMLIAAPAKATLTSADDVAADVESWFKVVSALADLIATLHVTVAVDALGVESATLVQLSPCKHEKHKFMKSSKSVASLQRISVVSFFF